MSPAVTGGTPLLPHSRADQYTHAPSASRFRSAGGPNTLRSASAANGRQSGPGEPVLMNSIQRPWMSSARACGASSPAYITKPGSATLSKAKPRSSVCIADFVCTVEGQVK